MTVTTYRFNKETKKVESVETTRTAGQLAFYGGDPTGLKSPIDGHVFKSRYDHQEYCKRKEVRIRDED